MAIQKRPPRQCNLPTPSIACFANMCGAKISPAPTRPESFCRWDGRVPGAMPITRAAGSTIPRTAKFCRGKRPNEGRIGTNLLRILCQSAREPLVQEAKGAASGALRSMTIRIGTAGWAIHKSSAAAFPGGGTHLQRYAERLNCVEINSSFYRPHKRATYQRWAESTPADFRFSVKIPRQITHEKRLIGCEPDIELFLTQVTGLGEQLGALLVQLPPSLAWGEQALSFFADLRQQLSGPLVCEPRHKSWFNATVSAALSEYKVGRVAADPSVVPAAASPDGFPIRPILGFTAHRACTTRSIRRRALHNLAATLLEETTRSRSVWCIFDNTALNAATGNALNLATIVSQRLPEPNDTSEAAV